MTEKELKTLIKELFELNELHHEYQDNDNHYVIDSNKQDNILTIRIELKENEDKKEFEKWVNDLDDDFFNEVWESFPEGELHKLDLLYKSDDYKEVIKSFKDKARELAKNKIKKLQSVLN